MATVQSTYQETHDVAVAGMMADVHTCDVDSYEFEGDDSDSQVGRFGYAVRLGTGAGKCKMPITGTPRMAPEDFVGILVMDRTLNADQNDRYNAGDVASVLVRGTIWVEVDAAVAIGDLVTINPLSGQFSTGDVGVGGYEVTAPGTNVSAGTTASVSGGDPKTAAAPGTVVRTGSILRSIGAGTPGSGYIREPAVALSNGSGTARAFLNRIPLFGARYLTAATAGNLAKLRLAGGARL